MVDHARFSLNPLPPLREIGYGVKAKGLLAKELALYLCAGFK